MITFIIGNGFDLNLGMKTRYTDVYDSYIKSPSKSKVIENFKAKIADDYENWSDFEMGMAEFAREFATEDEFVACVRDFKQHMVLYLVNEQNRFVEMVENNNTNSDIARVFLSTFQNFYNGSTPNVTKAIDRIIDTYGSKTNFITFNYTTILDNMVMYAVQYFQNRFLDWENPIHIHGTLNNDVVLGVDTIDQIKNNFLSGKKLQRAFVKPYFNTNFDDERVSRAKEIILSSKIICAFGWSFGKTDVTWVNLLKDWLISDANHHLVVLKYGDYKYPLCNSDERMDKEDEMKDEMIRVFDLTTDEMDVIYDRIHIPVGHGMFNFKIIKTVNSDNEALSAV